MAVYVRLRLRQTQVRQARFGRLAQKILTAAGEEASELSVELVDDRRMRRLNRLYRSKDRTTDVLAFPMREADNPCPSLLGDVVISVPTALRQAREAGRRPEDEVAILLVHGVLHLCGYDHERSRREAARMRRREQAILRAIGPVPRLMIRHAERGGRRP
jgi:rRNA maturation RNase YbeY